MRGEQRRKSIFGVGGIRIHSQRVAVLCGGLVKFSLLDQRFGKVDVRGNKFRL